MNRRIGTLCLASLLLVTGCDTSVSRAAPPTPPTRARVARVDTIRGSLADSARALLIDSEHGQQPAVLLALGASDVGTCEDLGRQARELQRWADRRNLRFIVWVEQDSADVLDMFLRRERIRPVSVIRSASLLVSGNQQATATPAAFLVQPDGTVQGTAHPDRVSNVRTRSFADELEALLPGFRGRNTASR
ncbi:hypothetical protein [Longimicrobium sp.]|uniref:hypothetical protein n=1 Tax=Longimicrobium sp. TaxID=2029185 RepID=UPI002E2EE3E4|nr:hypothetical protein [Longimicrobium sp.]HEX6041015.1 hypothetical protein [Longimicrobium sp.]